MRTQLVEVTAACVAHYNQHNRDGGQLLFQLTAPEGSIPSFSDGHIWLKHDERDAFVAMAILPEEA